MARPRRRSRRASSPAEHRAPSGGDRARVPEPIGEVHGVDAANLPDIVEAGTPPELGGARGARAMVRATARLSVLAAVVGIAAGLGTAVFITGLNLVVSGVDNVRSSLAWWLIVIFPPIGGLAVGLLLWRADRVAFVSACGTDSFIDAVEEADGRIPRRVPILRTVGAWLTIGFGGSSGRECPMIYTGSGLGSTVAMTLEGWRARAPRPVAAFLDLSPADTRMLAICGAAGALGAVFSAPFGGAIFAVEVPYRRDIDMGIFIPALVSSLTGFAVGALLVGRQRLLDASGVHALTWQEWVLVALIAGAASLVARLFAWWFNHFHDVVRHTRERHRLPAWAQPALGGLLAGLVMLAFPQVYGIGEQAVRDIADGRLFTGHTLAVATLLFVGLGLAKMAATAFTVGTGGVGGLLFPSFFVGAALGGLAANLSHGLDPGPFSNHLAIVLIAMSATYAAAGKVPLAALLLLCEATAATGNVALVLPLMAANLVAFALSGRPSVYDVQRETSARHHRGYGLALCVLVAVVLLNHFVVTL